MKRITFFSCIFALPVILATACNPAQTQTDREYWVEQLVRTVVYLALGLPAENEFWSALAQEWTSQKIWSRQELRLDHDI